LDTEIPFSFKTVLVSLSSALVNLQLAKEGYPFSLLGDFSPPSSNVRNPFFLFLFRRVFFSSKTSTNIHLFPLFFPTIKSRTGAALAFPPLLFFLPQQVSSIQEGMKVTPSP